MQSQRSSLRVLGNSNPQVSLSITCQLLKPDYTSNPLLSDQQKPFPYLAFEVGELSRNTRKHCTRSIADDLLQRSQQIHVLAVTLTTDDMAGFGCAHCSEYLRNIWRVLEPWFNRTDAFRDDVVPTMVVKFAGEFVSVLGTGKECRSPFSPQLYYER